MAERARRTDAVDNRARVVAEARTALAAANGGTGDLRMNLIARAAGVGQATMYRNFPTREHLLAEVYRQEIDDLTAAVPVLLDRWPPLHALRAWFDEVVEYARVKRGVIAVLEASAWLDLYEQQHTRIEDALQRMLSAGQVDGSVRVDVDVSDVLLLLGTLSRLDGEQWDTRAPRIVDVIVDGISR